jgi:hypothetical protein
VRNVITLNGIEVKEASRVYGDFVEKKAFEVDMNPANIIGSLAGGYAATRTYQKIEDKALAKQQASRTIENNHYDNVQNILRDLKIIFTPINVVYSVSGQVFEIIKVNEMTPVMKERFLMKDGEYFKGILINKMNMELQLAEQIFARRLLQPHLPGEFKQAHFSMQWFDKVSEEIFEQEEHKLMEKAADAQSFSVGVNLDALRPLNDYVDFFDKGITKVASPLDYFQSGLSEVITQKDMNKQIKIGFLPDRVVFLLNGQLVDQLSILHMNEEGFEAFKLKNEPFFLEFFAEESERIGNSVLESVMSNQPDAFADLPKQANEEDDENTDEEDLDVVDDEDDEEKTAASLEEMMEEEWIESLPTVRPSFELFYDNDIHPVVYDRILEQRIGANWHELELEAVLKEIEIEFKLDKAIGAIAFDKVALIHTIQNPAHSVFSTAFSFEKFVRTMNNKTTTLTDFEGGIEFEELLFALDVAKAIVNQEVYMEFGNLVAQYVSEELFQDNIRFVSDQLFDEDNEQELDFWTEVNGYLLRKWKERDAKGLEEEESATIKMRTETINDAGERILANHAEDIDWQRPYDSIADILASKTFASENEFESGVEQAIIQTTGRHVIASVFLQVKISEAIESVRMVGGE